MLLLKLSRPYLEKSNLFRNRVIAPFLYFLAAKIKKMSVVAVRSVEDEERLQISFRYGTGIKERLYNLDRLKNENLGLTLQRLQLNILKNISNKSKNIDPQQEISVKLTSEGKIVDNDTINRDAWVHGVKLHISDSVFDVKVNVPAVRNIEIPAVIMVGFPIFPRIDYEFVTNSEECILNWFTKKLSESEANKAKKMRPMEEADWLKVAEGSYYEPTERDLDCHLKVECTPVKESERGLGINAMSKNIVRKGPEKCPYHKRHQITQSLLNDKGVRVVSYNILADLYADSDFSREMLFPHCPAEFLDIDYRVNLILQELTGYNSDIICLQEVDHKVFKYNLLPVLSKQGFLGYFRGKGDIREGSCVFFRESKFRLLGAHDVAINKALEDQNHSSLNDQIKKCSPLLERLEKRNSTLQVLVLESIAHPEKRVCVATTHLYFHPNADHIRLIQTHACLQHIKSVINEYSDQDKPAVIFAGDLNSTVNTAVIRLLSSGMVYGNDPDWYSAGKPEYAGGLELKHTLPLMNACGEPKFTNFVPGFKGTLDWIFVDSEQFSVLQIIPLPDTEEILAYSALPSAVFPSDHLALLCDLQWCDDCDSSERPTKLSK